MKAKVSVTGGKGGTGKSTVAVNLAVLLAEERGLVLADLDVEAPNDHVLLNVGLENEEPVEIMLPFIVYPKCTRCGVCAQVCDTGAIILTREKLPFVIPRLCSGCRACYYACPYDAIVEGKRVIGYTYETRISLGEKDFTLVTGVLREGEEHTPPVVLAARRRAMDLADDLLLVDTSAGTANHVSIALENSDLVLAVTEPTPLGVHDLELILELSSILGAESWVIVNRSTIGDLGRVEEVASKYNARIAAKIPYAREIVESYVRGRPIVKLYPDHPVSQSFRTLAKQVLEAV